MSNRRNQIEAMLARGMTQADAARALGIRPASVQGALTRGVRTVRAVRPAMRRCLWQSHGVLFASSGPGDRYCPACRKVGAGRE